MELEILRKYYFFLVPVIWCQPDFIKKMIRNIKNKYKNTMLNERKMFRKTKKIIKIWCRVGWY